MTITESCEREHRPRDRAAAQPDTLYVGYTSNGDNRDYFQVPAAAGNQRIIHLSHLHVDDDLVVYGQGIAPLRAPKPGAEAPAAGEIGRLGQRGQPHALSLNRCAAEAAVGQVLGVSDNRGLADEEVRELSRRAGAYVRSRSRASTAAIRTSPGSFASRTSPAIPLPDDVQPAAGRAAA